MSHTSPATFLAWSIMSTMLFIFLLYHLWSFDRFRCLKWHTGPYSGAFKRVMTYTYILGVPLVLAYSVGFAVIKYEEGLIFAPGFGVVAKPHYLWTDLHQSMIFPLILCFSVAWSFEMVTHLQELCFWLFLINSGVGQQDWFRSIYFGTWVTGSTVAVAYMPLTTIFTRQDHLRNEAITFLAGSLGSLSLTIAFLPVLFIFPSFLRRLKAEDVDMGTIVRLTKFHEMNILRIIFRFLFTIPLVILGSDGLRPHKHINESMFWTDFIAVLAGFGFIISSGITLVIFFPRSIENEITAREARRAARRRNPTSTMLEDGAHTQTGVISEVGTGLGQDFNHLPATKERFSMLSRMDSVTSSQYAAHVDEPETPNPLHYNTDIAEGSEAADAQSPVVTESGDAVPRATRIKPNRRVGSTVELGGIERMSEYNLARLNNFPAENRMRIALHRHAVENFRSPIDVMNYTDHSRESTVRTSARNESRYTFNAL